MNNIDTVVFDYDGTLHDTSKIYIAAFRSAYADLVREGYAEERDFSDSDVTKWLGCTASEMWDTFMPQLPDEVKKMSAGRIRSVMAQLIRAGRSRLYDGVPEALSRLKNGGKRLVIMSNCANAYMEEHRRQFALDRFFCEYFCAEQYNYIPKYDILKIIIEKYGASCCVVGDRHHDIEAARMNGVRCVGCRYGFGTEEEIAAADDVIDDIRELGNIIFDRQLISCI